MTLFASKSLATGLLLFSLGCSGVPGPDSTENDLRPPSTDFQKVAGGTWMSECISFQENEASLSERKVLTLNERSAQSSTQVFATTDCSGASIRSENLSSPAGAHHRFAPESQEIQIELLSAQSGDYVPYRVFLSATISEENLVTRVNKMSYWERGQEVWVPDEDLALLPSTIYRRSSPTKESNAAQ